jgi:hypothetical protein
MLPPCPCSRNVERYVHTPATQFVAYSPGPSDPPGAGLLELALLLAVKAQK